MFKCFTAISSEKNGKKFNELLQRIKIKFIDPVHYWTKSVVQSNVHEKSWLYIETW